MFEAKQKKENELKRLIFAQIQDKTNQADLSGALTVVCQEAYSRVSEIKITFTNSLLYNDFAKKFNACITNTAKKPDGTTVSISNIKLINFCTAIGTNLLITSAGSSAHVTKSNKVVGPNTKHAVPATAATGALTTSTPTPAVRQPLPASTQQTQNVKKVLLADKQQDAKETSKKLPLNAEKNLDKKTKTKKKHHRDKHHSARTTRLETSNKDARNAYQKSPAPTRQSAPAILTPSQSTPQQLNSELNRMLNTRIQELENEKKDRWWAKFENSYQNIKIAALAYCLNAVQNPKQNNNPSILLSFVTNLLTAILTGHGEIKGIQIGGKNVQAKDVRFFGSSKRESETIKTLQSVKEKLARTCNTDEPGNSRTPAKVM